MGHFINFIALIAVIFVSLKGIGLAALCVALNVFGYYVVSPNILWAGIPLAIAALVYYIWDVTH